MHRIVAILLICATCSALSQNTSGYTMPPDTVPISGGVWAGQLIPESKVAPVYPEDARKAHIAGSVVMQITTAKDGSVEDLKTLSGPAELRAAAEIAVKQWRYKVYTLHRVPQHVQSTVTVNFNLTH